MNLGDGLLFQLENGKPRLILSNHGVEKNPRKIMARHRIQNEQAEHPLSGEPVEGLVRVTGRRAAQPNTGPALSASRNPSKTQTTTEASSKAVARVRPAKVSEKPNKQLHADKFPKTNGKADLKDSMVCLTNEQLQQILSSINNGVSSTAIGPEDQEVSQSHARSGKMENGDALLSRKKYDSQEKENSGGLFSSFGEREKDRGALEAQKAQWKRELDEQLALKQHPTGNRADALTTQEGFRRPAPSVVVTPSQSPAFRDLPAAIRSSFIVGEGTPVDRPFSEEKREQQRRWLQELNQQREEMAERRQREKQLQRQTEDHEHWASHFDSLQRPAPAPEPASYLGQAEAVSSLSPALDRGSPPGRYSLAGQSTASVDKAPGQAQRTSHLRTMTALLDPTQIEERERRRGKQQEHQRAIEAQVKERRQQRDREEAARQAQEAADERRVALERDVIQQQYLQDTQKWRSKEEKLSRQTEKVFRSVQLAREEALRSKQQQRIRELTRKGHDVSKLLLSPQGQHTVGESVCASEPEEAADRRALRQEGSGPLPWRHTAVQTEPLPERVHAVHTPDMSVESHHHDHPHHLHPPRDAGQTQRHINPGEDRVCLDEEGVVGARGGGGGGRGEELYDAFARTDKNSQRDMRRPGWNTQRPSRRYVPASERYPAELQRSRQERRLHRQIELRNLMEKSCMAPGSLMSRTHQLGAEPAQNQNSNQDPNPDTSTTPDGSRTIPSRKGAGMSGGHYAERGSSPPVPAVKHRLQKQQASSPPPHAHFVPFVRTEEVYHLEPLAPLFTPPQGGPRPDFSRKAPGSAPLQRDPLLHPEMVNNKERQQAILKGLSVLRQGLLQKRKENEMGLNPLVMSATALH